MGVEAGPRGDGGLLTSHGPGPNRGILLTSGHDGLHDFEFHWELVTRMLFPGF